MHLSRLGLLVHLVASSEWALGMHRHAHGLDPYGGVYGLIAGALTRAQGGWACTSARTSPTPFLFFLIGWLGGHGARNGMQLFSVYSISCASVTRITLAPNVFCRGGGIA